MVSYETMRHQREVKGTTGGRLETPGLVLPTFLIIIIIMIITINNYFPIVI